MHKTHHLSSRVAGTLFIFLLVIFAGKSSLAAGWVDVNIGVNISPSTVTVGKNFDVSFSLKEYRGESKNFEYIQIWIQDGSGNDLYDAAIWNNVSFSSYQQKNFTATTSLDPARGRRPGTYRAIVRGKIVGDVPFNFGIVSGSGGVNPRTFSATPIIAQGPMSGPPGTTFTQWGEGFTANSTATLHFKKPDGTEYPTQQQAMDSAGHFETQYTAPTDKAPGQYTWWAVDGPTGISSNQVTYTIEKPPVNPAVAQSPMSGVPGTIFTQWGTGFTPNSTATLHFKKPDGTEYPTQQQAMDSTGHFETKYTAPLDKAPGQYTWWAVDGPTGISSNQVTYTIEQSPVNPAVAQSPMSGVPGTVFTQWGTGFTPNSTATLHFKKPDGTEYPTQQQAMDSTGHFETKYPSPLDKAPGQYTWWAVDGPTGISSNQVTYTIEKPPVNPAVAQSPMSGVPGTTFTQWGTGFTPNSTATLHFKKPDGTEYEPVQQPIDNTGHFETPYPSPKDKAPGQYTWWAVDGPTGVSSNQVKYTIEMPTINPIIAQTPMFGKSGTIFKQWGTGFRPNSTAILHFRKPDSTEYEPKIIQIDGEGHFVTSYTVPADKPAGLYTWWVVDDYSKISSNQVTYSIFPDSQDVADIEVSIIESKAMYSAGDILGYSIYVKNYGENDVSDVTIDITCTEGFDIDIDAANCSGTDSSTCQAVEVKASSAKFTASVNAGQYIAIKVYGQARTGCSSITLTAEAHDSVVHDPLEANNKVTSILRTFVPNLPGNQDSRLLTLPESSKTPSSVDTVVLTHGLQGGFCDASELWTGSKSNPAQAGYLIQEDLKAKGKSANIYQFFWKGACQGTGATRYAYIDARQNVHFAAQQLANQLYDKLGPNYDKKIHFIGHSLGTAVNAYAADIFLKKETNISKAQVTILDHPNHIGKIPLFILKDNESEKEWGFDENFFAHVLPFYRQGLKLYVDNYYSAKSESNKLVSAGVGSEITGDIFNHAHLVDPHEIGDELLDEDGSENDHSGVHQWYRWTIRTGEGKNFDIGENNSKSVCSNDGIWNGKPEGVNDTLNPCKQRWGGWQDSILLNDTMRFWPNGNSAGPTNSTSVTPSSNTQHGCGIINSNGSLLSALCIEAPITSASPASNVTSLAAEPQIPKSSIEFTVTVPKFLRYISFDYSFPNIGDGDYIYIFLDGVPVWKMSSEGFTAGETVSSSLIPARAAAGQKKLIIVLYGVGQQNAQFSLNNFKFTTAADTDSDDFADDEDEFPNNPNEWLDTDKDGIGNNGDTDDDNDEFLDTDDAFSLNPKENADTDGDGIGDYADLDDNMYPDLAVISRSLNKTGLAPGEDFICWAAVKNKGTARTTAAPVRYYLSTDSTINRSDLLLGSSTAPLLNSGSTSWVRADLNAPNESGTYWLGSCVDTVSGDSNEANNCSFGFKITIATQLPDLTVSSLSAPYQLKTGERFNINLQVTNQGTLESIPTTATIRYVDAATLANLPPIHQENIPALTVNQTISRSPSIKAPCQAGDYFLSACVDSGENIERGENNNCDFSYVIVNQGDGVCIEVDGKSSILPAINLLLKR